MIEQYYIARNYFVEYSMKLTYDEKDKEYNFQRAQMWNNIMIKLRNKL